QPRLGSKVRGPSAPAACDKYSSLRWRDHPTCHGTRSCWLWPLRCAAPEQRRSGQCTVSAHHGRSILKESCARRRISESSAFEPCRMVPGARSMTPVEDMTDQEFDRYALEVLQRELGPGGLARFLRLNRSRGGDYTRDRNEWQRNLKV